MTQWIREAWGSLPAWGRVIVVVAIVALLAWALFLGRDLSPIWGVLD
ncbi:MAG: hypothetical protein KDE20_02560 [Caldilineaceae bacterium]|nr:hypothetical protein [Caldilineaceae bacterium]MCB0158193.1 hypothetical protein [Caldilineaceae bacterium]